MELINYLIYILEVLGLVFVIGIVINLILDAIIINPIINRKILRQKAKMFDIIIEQAEKGELNSQLVKVDCNQDEEIEK